MHHHTWTHLHTECCDPVCMSWTRSQWSCRVFFLSSASLLLQPSCPQNNVVLLQMLLTLVNLWCPLKYVVRAGLVLGIWFIIMDPPVRWAKQAQAWQEAGADTAGAFWWTTSFLPVHSVIWRLLLVYLLYTTVGLVRSALGKHLSIHTHHAHHFPKMQVRPPPHVAT